MLVPLECDIWFFFPFDFELCKGEGGGGGLELAGGEMAFPLPLSLKTASGDLLLSALIMK